MLIEFDKYHGAGNDFIMIDCRSLHEELFTSEKVSFLCDRHLGIGADGLILLLAGQKGLRMKYFNSDGNEGTMCGNGGRCFTSFANRLGLISDHIVFFGIDGKHEAFLMNNNIVRLRMIDVAEVQALEDGYLLDTGSKHFVLFRSEIENLDVRGEGRKIRHESRFGSAGANVNFVNYLGDNCIEIRTFERGVEDETLACGTGAVASAISAYIKTGTDKSSFEVLAKGGKLFVTFDVANSGFSNIWLEGPTQYVFSGNIILNASR